MELVLPGGGADSCGRIFAARPLSNLIQVEPDVAAVNFDVRESLLHERIYRSCAATQQVRGIAFLADSGRGVLDGCHISSWFSIYQPR